MITCRDVKLLFITLILIVSLSHFLIFLPVPCSVFLSRSLFLSIHFSLSASYFWTVWVDPPNSTISHSWCCFSHYSLCPSPFPTFRPVTALTGSDAGRDDSRARFSLWVYYLCSGPFKTTQNSRGSQCGEFVLTSCLSLLISSASSSSYPLPSSCLFTLGELEEDCGPSRDSLFPVLCLLFLWDLATRRHLVFRLTLPLMENVVYIVWNRVCVHLATC